MDHGVWMQIDLDLPEKPETRLIAMHWEPIDVVCGRLLLFWRLVERECYGNAGALPNIQRFLATFAAAIRPSEA